MTTLEHEPFTSDDGATYTAWTDGAAVGFKITFPESDRAEYVYLNPSGGSDDGVNTVFLYQGDTGDSSNDSALIHLTVGGDLFRFEWNDTIDQRYDTERAVRLHELVGEHDGDLLASEGGADFVTRISDNRWDVRISAGNAGRLQEDLQQTSGCTIKLTPIDPDKYPEDRK